MTSRTALAERFQPSHDLRLTLERECHRIRHTRLAPTLQCKPADQAEAPALGIAATLQFLGCAINLKHVRAPS